MSFVRALLRKLANDTQLVDRLADSKPIRRAAQLGAYAFHRGKAFGEEAAQKAEQSLPPNIKDALRDLNEGLKKKK